MREYNPPGTPTVYALATALTNGTIRTRIEYDFSPDENNGNVQAQRVRRMGSLTEWEQTYTYDGVNRLETAAEAATGSGSGWSRSYGYDRYGNRWIKPLSYGISSSTPAEPTLSSHYNPDNNRLVMAGVSYDPAGNQTSYDGMTLTYDAEGRNITAIGNGTNVTFTYDGEGRRVKKVSGGVTTYYIYNALGQLAAEYSNGSAQAGTSYLFTDMLGSVRTITDAGNMSATPPVYGAVIECYDYLPFGRILSKSDNGRKAVTCHSPDPNNLANSKVDEKFTGQKHDTETGLDYFGARYYSPALGRFTSPDLPLFAQSAELPQSWNLYSHTRNNPLKFVDSDGRSTHTDSYGSVVAVYNDGDFGIYRHSNLDWWDRVSTLPKRGDGIFYMGETEFLDEFMDPSTGKYFDGARIEFGASFDKLIRDLNNDARKMYPGEIALNSLGGEMFDIKSHVNNPFVGRMLNGKYVTVRSAGNYLAGLNAASVGVPEDKKKWLRKTGQMYKW
jgi:RHS repeat-associated protein